MHKLQAFIFTYRGALLPLSLLPAAAMGVTGGGRIRFAVSLPLLNAGICIRLLGVREIGERARVRAAGARELVSSGIFGRLRNPLYVGNALALGGISSLYFSLWATPLVIGSMMGLYTLVALYEEKCLLQQFGEAYRKYKARVPRWWINLRSYPNSEDRISPVSWREVLRLERYFISCCLVLTLIASSGITQIPWFTHIPCTMIVLLVALALFLWIAVRLHKRRGSWLCFERTSGQGIHFSLRRRKNKTGK